jgi:hypothetical protein
MYSALNPIPLRTFECGTRRAVIQAVGYKDSDRGSPDSIQVPRDVCFQQTWGKIFLEAFGHCPVSIGAAAGSKQTLTQWVLGVFPGRKAPGACWWTTPLPPPPSSAEVKESVDLYLYCLSVPSWQVMGWSLPLPCQYHFIDATYSLVFHRRCITQNIKMLLSTKFLGFKMASQKFY